MTFPHVARSGHFPHLHAVVQSGAGSPSGSGPAQGGGGDARAAERVRVDARRSARRDPGCRHVGCDRLRERTSRAPVRVRPRGAARPAGRGARPRDVPRRAPSAARRVRPRPAPAADGCRHGADGAAARRQRVPRRDQPVDDQRAGRDDRRGRGPRRHRAAGAAGRARAAPRRCGARAARGAAAPGAAAGEPRPARWWRRARLQQPARCDHELRGVPRAGPRRHAARRSRCRPPDPRRRADRQGGRAWGRTDPAAAGLRPQGGRAPRGAGPRRRDPRCGATAAAHDRRARRPGDPPRRGSAADDRGRSWPAGAGARQPRGERAGCDARRWDADDRDTRDRRRRGRGARSSASNPGRA